jgi:hypothetical protein
VVDGTDLAKVLSYIGGSQLFEHTAEGWNEIAGRTRGPLTDLVKKELKQRGAKRCACYSLSK